MFVLLSGCGGFQVHTEILSPSFATATTIAQTQQARPTNQSMGFRVQTVTPTLEIIPTLPIVTPSPTLTETSFISWDRLINYDLLKDIDWVVYSKEIGTTRGLRRYALAVPDSWTIDPEVKEGGLVITSFHPLMEDSPQIERVRLEFRSSDDYYPMTSGHQQKIRINGEPGELWTQVIELDQHMEYQLLFEHDGTNYIFWASIDLPSADHIVMAKFQAILLYSMSSLIID